MDTEVRDRRSAEEKISRRWVKEQVKLLARTAAFRGLQTIEIYRRVGLATGLIYPPPGWAQRKEMLEAFFAGGRATGVLEKRAARDASRRQKRKARIDSKQSFDAFYESREWQRVRYQALKLYGKKCGCCESTDGPFHVDHIKPRSKFPELELEISNLQVLCKDCNLGKGGWDQTDWRGVVSN